MADREKVISNLQGVYEYLRHFENTAKMGEWVSDALALLKEQEEQIKNLHDEIEFHAEWFEGYGKKIVRCKDCKHKEESVSPSWEAWCNRLHCGCDLDWFCADGEVRE